MKLKSWKIIFLVIFVLKTAFSLPSLDEIDQALKKVNEDSTYAQEGLIKRLSELLTDITTTNNELKAKNLAPTLSTYLDNIAQLIQQFKTMDYFETYEVVSTCNDVNYKIITMELDVVKMREIIVKGNFNVTQIYPNYSWANYYYLGLYHRF